MNGESSTWSIESWRATREQRVLPRLSLEDDSISSVDCSRPSTTTGVAIASNFSSSPAISSQSVTTVAATESSSASLGGRSVGHVGEVFPHNFGNYGIVGHDLHAALLESIDDRDRASNGRRRSRAWTRGRARPRTRPQCRRGPPSARGRCRARTSLIKPWLFGGYLHIVRVNYGHSRFISIRGAQGRFSDLSVPTEWPYCIVQHDVYQIRGSLSAH